MTVRFDAATTAILPSSRVTEVHLFRHPEVITGDARICRGHSDVALSERGLAQIDSLAARWAGGWNAVYSSDLQRCWRLAERLGPCTRSASLREQDMGAWEGQAWDHLTERDPTGTTAYWDDYVNARPPGGESYGESALRVRHWWEQTSPSGRVAVVTHIGCIRALLCGWLGLGPDQALRWAPAYGSHTEVLVADAGVVINRFGEV